MRSMTLFLLRRLAAIPVTLFFITALLYGAAMFAPPEQRAELFMPKNLPSRLTEADVQRLVEKIIREKGLNDPYPVQYGRWLVQLIQGEWGRSPVLNDDVLAALLRRTPATAELALYSLVVFIPLGLASGVVAAANQNRPADLRFRLAAFVATSLPPFILAIILIAIFYVQVHWFPPERLSIVLGQEIRSPDFHIYTGLYTLDGLLNNRPDISLDALRHLVLPVVTLSLLHWATLGRVTRAVMIEELSKEYIVAAEARGLAPRAILWRHALSNALPPALTSTALSAASLLTGVFVVEIIYGFHGIGEMIQQTAIDTPDTAVILGFALYSVILVLLLMLALDIIQALVDPRVREEMAEA